MRITNHFDLPEAFVRFEERNEHTRDGADISVTELIDSPRIHTLKVRHNDDIEEDISGRVMALLGTAVHNVLEQGAPAGCSVEERLFTVVDGIQLSGQIDLQTPSGDGILISDYKTTSVYAVKANPEGKAEWEQQLNIYAALAEANGRIVNGLEVVVVIRDWSAAAVARSYDYPKVPILRIPITMWEAGYRDKYISGRIRDLLDNPERECTPEERWERGTKWAVYKHSKNGSVPKRAHRVFDTEVEAQELMFQLDGYASVKFRQGQSIRCEHYCPVSNFCSQWKTIQENNDD